MLIHILFAAGAVLVGFLLQSSVFGLIPFLVAVPNFLLLITMSFALLKGSRFGMIVGFFAGLLLDIMQGGLIGFYALIFVYIGFLNGLPTRFFSQDQLFIPLIFTVLDEIVVGLYYYVFHCLLQGQFIFRSYFTGSVMAEMTLSLIASVFVYGILMSINSAIETRQRKKEVKFG